MKTPIFKLLGSNLLPSTNLDFRGSNLVNSEAPTSRAPTLYLVQAPTWFLEDSDPLGLHSYLIQGTNLEFRSTNSKDTNLIFAKHQLGLSKAPTLSILRHQPQGLQPYSFTLSRYVWLYFTAPQVFFNEPCLSSTMLPPNHFINNNLLFSDGVTTVLHITQAKISKVTS